MKRLSVFELSWPRFVSVFLFAIGIWLESLFAALLIPGLLGYQSFQRNQATLIEDFALMVFAILGFLMIGLSFFIWRQKNWARLTIVGSLLVASLVAFGLLLVRLLSWRFHTPNDIGGFIVGLGFLILPLSIAAFLLNKQVADQFRPPPDRKVKEEGSPIKRQN